MRIPQQRIAETVAGELRDRILTGTDRLPTQDQLVAEFGVSYPSVREALRILETEGLVTVRRGSIGGAEVHRPDQSSAAYHLGLALQGSAVSLGDLAEGLQLLEPMCAAEVARRPDRLRTAVPALSRNVDSCAEVVADGAAFTRIAREFHDLMVEFTPNATVRHVVGSLVALWSAQEEKWADAVVKRGEYPSPTQAREAVRTHRRMVEVIAAGDAAAAARIARQHLAATQEVLLDRFNDDVVRAKRHANPNLWRSC
ncbi:FadR/GntR family transcriptional regulator [Mycolicibacterium sp. A43C]